MLSPITLGVLGTHPAWLPLSDLCWGADRYPLVPLSQPDRGLAPALHSPTWLEWASVL